MNVENYEYEANYKKLGYLAFNSEQLEVINAGEFQSFIKIFLIPAGYKLTVDFDHYETKVQTLFFIAPNQFLHVLSGSEVPIQFLYYNRDFYCIQIHDAEVACDGLLFINILSVPKIDMDVNESGLMVNVFQSILRELKCNDSSSEEMIRTYLKQIIIRATRIWKRQNISPDNSLGDHSDKELFRSFGRLVEIHYMKKHSVTDYAELLNLSPKTLANKFNKLQLENPNDIIKKRIVLEAKRLLFYTDLHVKEIAYQLGYEDPAYFNRLFTQKAGDSPAGFRKHIKSNN
jgi:AraC-like DNA-binding protein